MAHTASRRQFLHVSALALALAAPAWSASPAGDAGAERLARHVEQVLAPSSFSGAILVSRRGELLLGQGFGQADIEQGVANTPDTVFRIGSISKQFTAAVILALAERELLDLEALAGEYWVDCPASWSEVTVRHLLNHTSGIPSVTDLDAFYELCEQPLRPAESLALVTGMPLEFAPGSRWKYSNSGYLLLALIAETVGEQPFEELLDELILQPLELSHTGSEVHTGPVSGLARPYGRQAGGEPQPGPPIDMNFPTGGGGVHSTVDDMLRWARAIEGRELLSQASWEAMLTPAQENYGFGIVISPVAGQPCIHHGGSINGFESWLGLFPEQGLVVVVLANVSTEGERDLNPQVLGSTLAEQVLAPRAEPVPAGG